MSVLTATRQATADLLGEALDIQSFAAMPDRIVPPSVIVLPGSPYLSNGNTFGTFTAQLSVVLVTDAKVNATATTALDELIENATVALINAGISVSEASEPWQLSSANATYLASTLTTTQNIAL